MKGEPIFIVAAVGEWNKDKYIEFSSTLPGLWHLVDSPAELNDLLISQDLQPNFVFFLHWRWIVPKSIIDRVECICFHMTDVPFGRGGSPLQNLIARGHKSTRLTALRMVEQLDAGPVYMKKTLNLDGPAHAIYKRASALSWEMIEEIILERPQPRPQQGDPIEFRRRTPEQSKLDDGKTLEQIYDHIRMLDAPGYPKAFIETENYRLELDSAELNENSVQASCNIFLKRNET